MVYFGKEKVYNADGTQYDVRVKSWIQFWNFFSEWQADAGCITKCRISETGGVVSPDTHNYYGKHCVGGHMEKETEDYEWHYILPICGKHNAPTGFYDRINGRWMLTTDDAYAVEIPRAFFA